MGVESLVLVRFQLTPLPVLPVRVGTHTRPRFIGTLVGSLERVNPSGPEEREGERRRREGRSLTPFGTKIYGTRRRTVLSMGRQEPQGLGPLARNTRDHGVDGPSRDVGVIYELWINNLLTSELTVSHVS